MNKEASLSKFNFINSYEDTKRAEAYARLEFAGTYQLAYRDLPDIIFNNVQGKKAIDFGCGTGRSTRFLQKLGFNVIGIDITGDMVKKAKEIDPKGDYRRIDDGNFNQFKKNYYDLVLSVFTFDNIPIRDKKVRILSKIRDLLNENGRIINIVSAPEIYTNEWVSFSTKGFPEREACPQGNLSSCLNKGLHCRT